MTTKTCKLRMILEVTYELNGESPEALGQRLGSVANLAVEEGLLTGDGPAEVSDWTYAVEEVSCD